MMDQIRFWFGILPKNAKARLALFEHRCVQTITKSGIDHPQQFKDNMCAMAAWWAIPYYVYLFDEFEKREINPRLIQEASKLISAQAQRQLSFDPNNRELGYDKVSAAMDLVVFDMCRLWQAAFRENFEENPDAGYEQTAEYLKKTFTDPDMNLADKLWIYFETEEEKEERRSHCEEDGEEWIDDLEDFADCVTRLYFYCVKTVKQ